MWCYRRTLKIRIDRITKKILYKNVKRRAQMTGNMLRHGELLGDILGGEIGKKSGRGRTRLEYFFSIMKDMEFLDL